MSAQISLDTVDLRILELLRADGRRTVRDIARLVNLLDQGLYGAW
ncbi:AsnC family transcriptional regulator [Streptomyces hyaluromycini]|nr:AsnC family transcriptional regulator [Streptomyces hyaluromycini]